MAASGTRVPRTIQTLPDLPGTLSTAEHCDQSNCAALRSQAAEGASPFRIGSPPGVEEGFAAAEPRPGLVVAARLDWPGFSKCEPAELPRAGSGAGAPA